MSEKRSGLVRWGVPAALGAAGFLSLLAGRGGFEAATQAEFYHILCDALFVPGAMLTSAGLLAVVSAGGAFDAVSYAVKKLFSLLRSEEKRALMPRTYYDYVTSRRERPRRIPVSLLAVGGGMVAAAALVLVFYFRAAG